MNALLPEIISKLCNENVYVIDEHEIQLLNERKELYKSGKAATYSVQEIREKILKNNLEIGSE